MTALSNKIYQIHVKAHHLTNGNRRTIRKSNATVYKYLLYILPSKIESTLLHYIYNSKIPRTPPPLFLPPTIRSYHRHTKTPTRRTSVIASTPSAPSTSSGDRRNYNRRSYILFTRCARARAEGGSASSKATLSFVSFTIIPACARDKSSESLSFLVLSYLYSPAAAAAAWVQLA